MKKILMLAAFAAITFVGKAQTATPETVVSTPTPSLTATVVAEDKPAVNVDNKKETKATCTTKKSSAQNCDKKNEKSCDKDKKDGKKSCCSKKTDVKVEEVK